jgi:hypothetical protein
VAKGLFGGNQVTTYTQYLDLGNAGKTLVAHPALTYNITFANGWSSSGLPAVPGDGNWTLAAVGAVAFTAIPAQAIPGLSRPGWPGTVSLMGALPADLRVRDEAAGRAIFEDVRSRLIQMNEKVAVLRRPAQKPAPRPPLSPDTSEGA